MTTEQRPQRTVLAIVKSKAEEEDGWRLELDIPEFGSKFPTLCTRVRAEVAALLAPGQTSNLVLEQQSLKKGKDGKFPSHYYWGLVSLAPVGIVPAAALPEGPQGGKPAAIGQGGPRGGGWSEDSPEKRASIEAQTAYNGAVSLVAAKIRAAQLKPDSLHVELVELTCWGYEAIQQAKRTRAGVQHTEAAAPPTVPPALPTNPKTPPVAASASDTVAPAPEGQGAAASIPEFINRGDLMVWVWKCYGKNASEVWKARGYKSGLEDNGSPQEIAEFLVGAWGPPQGGG